MMANATAAGQLRKDGMEGLVSALRDLRNTPQMMSRLNAERIPNFWSIIEYGKDSYETRYSKMLRWLLDPTGNHGLGAFALRWLADSMQGTISETNRVLLNKKLREERGISFDDLTESERADVERDEENCLDPAVFLRPAGNFDAESYVPNDLDGAETEALGSHIDVFAHDRAERICLTIELKMGSDEHDSNTKDGTASQLRKYHDAVMSHPEYGTGEDSTYWHHYFLFLTPDGHWPPSFPKDWSQWEPWQRDWRCMSYRQLAEFLDQVLIKLRSADAAKIVRDFRDDVLRNADLNDDNASRYAPFESYVTLIDTLHHYFNGADTEGIGTKPSRGRQTATTDDATMRAAGKSFIVALANEGLTVADAKVMIDDLHDHFAIGAQDHTVNPQVQLLTRTVFNWYAADELDLTDPSRFGKETKEERLSPVKPQIARETGLTTICLTRGKGQGLRFYFGETGDWKNSIQW